MRPPLVLSVILVAACSAAFVDKALAQSTPSIETPETGVVLTNLSPPVYPPLARQARIMGDVKVQIGIRQDGSIASAEVIGGHPMLKQAALESAQKSTFACRGCGDPVTEYPMTYTFGFQDDGGCSRTWRVRSSRCLYLWKCGEEWHRPEYRAPEIVQAQGHITILVSSVCVDTEASR